MSQYEVNGHVVEFTNEPSEQDIDEAAQQLGPAQSSQSQQNPVMNFAGNVAHGMTEPFAKLAQTGPIAQVSRGLGSMAGGGKFDTTPGQANLPMYGNVTPPANSNEYAGNVAKASSVFMPSMGPAFGAWGGGQALTENKPPKDVVNSILLNAGLGKGLEFGAPIAGKAIGAIGKAIPQGLKDAGESLLESATGRLSKYTHFNANPARGLLSENVAVGGSPEEIQFKVMNRMEELKQAKESILNDPQHANTYVDASNLYEPIDQAMAQAKKAPSKNSTLISNLEKAQVDLERMVGEKDLSHLSLKEADQLKQDISSFDLTGNAAEKEHQNFQKVANSLYGNLNSQIHEASPELGEIGSRQHDLINASKALGFEDMLSGKTGKIASVSKRGGFWTGLGALGALLHGNPKLAGSLATGAIAEEALPSISGMTGVRSRMAQGLYNAGEGIEGAGQSVKDLIDRMMGKSQPVATPNVQSPYTPPTRGAGPYNPANNNPGYVQPPPIANPYGPYPSASAKLRAAIDPNSMPAGPSNTNPGMGSYSGPDVINLQQPPPYPGVGNPNTNARIGNSFQGPDVYPQYPSEPYPNVPYNPTTGGKGYSGPDVLPRQNNPDPYGVGPSKIESKSKMKDYKRRTK